MTDSSQNLAVSLFSELLAVDQLARMNVARVLPKGMELSHFMVLNHLAHSAGERSPAQLAKAFHLTRGAMTNTLNKLEWAGWIHVRPDWEDARRKRVAASPAGIAAREQALAAIRPIMADAVRDLGAPKVRAAIPVLRGLRQRFGSAE